MDTIKLYARDTLNSPIEDKPSVQRFHVFEVPVPSAVHLCGR